MVRALTELGPETRAKARFAEMSMGVSWTSPSRAARVTRSPLMATARRGATHDDARSGQAAECRVEGSVRAALLRDDQSRAAFLARVDRIAASGPMEIARSPSTVATLAKRAGLSASSMRRVSSALRACRTCRQGHRPERRGGMRSRHTECRRRCRRTSDMTRAGRGPSPGARSAAGRSGHAVAFHDDHVLGPALELDPSAKGAGTWKGDMRCSRPASSSGPARTVILVATMVRLRGRMSFRIGDRRLDAFQQDEMRVEMWLVP